MLNFLRFVRLGYCLWKFLARLSSSWLIYNNSQVFMQHNSAILYMWLSETRLGSTCSTVFREI